MFTKKLVKDCSQKLLIDKKLKTTQMPTYTHQKNGIHFGIFIQ